MNTKSHQDKQQKMKRKGEREKQKERGWQWGSQRTKNKNKTRGNLILGRSFDRVEYFLNNPIHKLAK